MRRLWRALLPFVLCFHSSSVTALDVFVDLRFTQSLPQLIVRLIMLAKIQTLPEMCFRYVKRLASLAK
jgi:hypothetical protein